MIRAWLQAHRGPLGFAAAVLLSSVLTLGTLLGLAWQAAHRGALPQIHSGDRP